MRKYLPHILIISIVLIAAPITSATGGSKILRSHYRSLSLDQVQSMANISISKKKDWGFYGHSIIDHDYNLKTIGGDKFVVDNTTGLMWYQSGSDDYMRYKNAKKWLKKLNKRGYAGYRDWGLPHCWNQARRMETCT